MLACLSADADTPRSTDTHPFRTLLWLRNYHTFVGPGAHSRISCWHVACRTGSRKTNVWLRRHEQPLFSGRQGTGKRGRKGDTQRERVRARFVSLRFVAVTPYLKRVQIPKSPSCSMVSSQRKAGKAVRSNSAPSCASQELASREFADLTPAFAVSCLLEAV